MAIHRQHKVLNRLVETQSIAPLEAELAKQQKVYLAPQTQNISAPHFVMYVKQALVEEFGEAAVEQGGLSVTTSLDLNLQQQAQAVVASEVDSLSPYHVTNGAALVTKPSTGEILAMVGSRDYFDTARDGQVNVVTRPRQPGSAIKPVNYAVALQNGYTAASVIEDSPVTYNIPGQPAYSPINYDGKFHGQVSLHQALANSYNVPAVKVLASYGVEKMIAMGQALGITTWNEPGRFGLSLTLGGGEVKMTDLAVVYGTLANQGKKVNLNPILKVTDAEGKTLKQFDCGFGCNSDPVLPDSVAFILTSILSDANARIPAFGANSLLNTPGHQVAVKTGTTNDKRDNWTIGFTDDFLVASWVGNNDNSPMAAVASGITGATPIWHELMTQALKDQPASQFTPPPSVVTASICPLTGTLGCSGCPNYTEFFVPGSQPQNHCSEEVIRDQILTGASSIRIE